MVDATTTEPRFRLVSAPSALVGAPAGWAREMLREGAVALLGDEGLSAVNAVAQELINREERPGSPRAFAEEAASLAAPEPRA